MDESKNLFSRHYGSITLILMGIVLLMYMVIAEDEPGGVPVLFIVAGIVWFIISKFRPGSQNRN
ncbi:MAG: hypothetical protein ROO71_12660 [Balneola sp.]